MMDRIEEFSRDGKNFIYIDYCGLASVEDLVELIRRAQKVIAEYPESSVYTISNIANFRIDSRIKEIFTNFMEFNKRYVKYGVIIGIDGIKKIMTQVLMKKTNRMNINFAFTKEGAIGLILQQEQGK